MHVMSCHVNQGQAGSNTVVVILCMLRLTNQPHARRKKARLVSAETLHKVELRLNKVRVDIADFRTCTVD